MCTQDFTFDGITIPQGQYMNINVWDIHHNAEYWPDPDTFNPEKYVEYIPLRHM